MTATPTAATTCSILQNIESKLADLELEPGYTIPPIILPTQIPLKGETLPPFITDGLHPSVHEAHQETRNWVAAILKKKQPYWLTLFGPSGCGKTFLARHARSHLRNKQRDCQLWNWSKAFDRLCDWDSDLMPHLCRLHILILDDIGTGYTMSDKTAELHSSKLYEILESRTRKFTLITTNLSPQQLREPLDARIASRLFRGENQIVDLTHADDYSYLQHIRKRKKP
jgi:DNA replication protein DnaC